MTALMAILAAAGPETKLETIHFPLEMFSLTYIRGDLAAVVEEVAKIAKNRQQIVFAGADHNRMRPYAEFLVIESDTGHLVEDKAAIPKDLLAKLQANDAVSYKNLIHATGKGEWILNGEIGFKGSPTRLPFADAILNLVFDEQGFVIGDPNRDRTLLLYGRDIARDTLICQKGGRAFSFDTAVAGQKVRHAMIGDMFLEVTEGGAKAAVVTLAHMRMLLAGKTVDWSITEILLDGATFEDISLGIDDTTFIATLKTTGEKIGEKRYLPIKLIGNAEDVLAFEPDFTNAIPVDQAPDHAGGLVRLSKAGATFVDRNGGEHALRFVPTKHLPAQLQAIAAQLRA